MHMLLYSWNWIPEAHNQMYYLLINYFIYFVQSFDNSPSVAVNSLRIGAFCFSFRGGSGSIIRTAVDP